MPINSTIFDLAVCGLSVKDTGAFRVEFSEYNLRNTNIYSP